MLDSITFKLARTTYEVTSPKMSQCVPLNHLDFRLNTPRHRLFLMTIPTIAMCALLPLRIHYPRTPICFQKSSLIFLASVLFFPRLCSTQRGTVPC